MYAGEIDIQADSELEQYSQAGGIFAKTCGYALATLHNWCQDGIPDVVEARVGAPGIVMYALKFEVADLIFWVAVIDGELILLAVGLLSLDRTSSDVFRAAIARL